ncbi:MAG: ornithine carbamoyltransferase [Candidatus Auribacterota bacterium]|jgi:ornithine carbamoyltransferase|nr:ornithine carbamoyltransferase [Candidatus Auribacterota bacterium]
MKDLISINDLSVDQINYIFKLAETLKKNPYQSVLNRRSMAMIFEKPSLRTRVTFEVGMHQLGGHAVYLQPSDIKLGERETVADAARNLERWVDIIMARTFKHETITKLAENCSIPVINALSDIEHPCQAMADFFTVLEHRKNFSGFTMAFVGDGNNVCHSLMLLSGKLGVNFILACPKGYEADTAVTAQTKSLMAQNGGSFRIVHDVNEAAVCADALYTDVWVSMGQEEETKIRREKFKSYQLNADLLKKASGEMLVMHCLPAHRGEEITDEVIDGTHSIVLDQAENRLHVQKAIILYLLHKDNEITV